jgi:hypothetical protein
MKPKKLPNSFIYKIQPVRTTVAVTTPSTSMQKPLIYRNFDVKGSDRPQSVKQSGVKQNNKLGDHYLASASFKSIKSLVSPSKLSVKKPAKTTKKGSVKKLNSITIDKDDQSIVAAAVELVVSE